jgi:hypothetical protein
LSSSEKKNRGRWPFTDDETTPTKTPSSLHSPTFQRFAVRSNAMAQELAKKSASGEKMVSRWPPFFHACQKDL